MSGVGWRAASSLGAVVAVLIAASAASVSAQVRDLFAIGRNALGESCSAQLDRNDPALAEPEFDKSYSLSCRSSLASRKVGSIRRVDSRASLIAAVEKTLQCGPAQTIVLKAIGQTRARRCADSTLGSQTLVLDFQRGGVTYYGSAGLALAGPLEQGLGLVSGAVTGIADAAPVKPSFAVESLPALAGAAAETQDVFNPENALRQGIRLNQQGLHIDASRQLNDAISRLAADTPVPVRGQLELEAGLADSNIGFFKSAEAHFARADQMMVGSSDPLVARKATSYRALHDINRRQFRSALERLDSLARDPGQSERPLMDPVVLAGVNMASRGSEQQSVATIGANDRAALQERALDAVVDWARSTASFALGDLNQSEAQIMQARRSFDVIRGSRIDVSQALWLDARIERQMGRIAARRQNYAAAVGNFDRAIAVLRDAQLRNPGFGSGEMAAAQLERADLLSRQGVPRERVVTEFAAAIDSVAAASAPGSVDPSSIERYLDILANGTDGNGDPSAADKFFRAVQVVDDPAIARQVAALQEVVSADPSLGAQFRERTDLSQELNSLSFRITRATGAEAAALEAERNRLQQRLQTVDDLLASNTKFQSTDDRPATVAEVRQNLREGESFFKLVTLKRSAFGIHITRDDAFVYRSPSAPAKLQNLAVQLRKTLVPNLQTGKLLPYRAGLAYELYRAVTGAATDRMASAPRLVVDPSGPLQTVPIGVLIVENESVRRFVAARKGRTDAADYSQLSFVAAASELSTALSPRSFVVARKAEPSRAPRKFMGFGQHALPTSELLGAFREFSTRTGCVVDAATLEESYNYPSTSPISAEELGIAARALGDPQAPEMTGQAFSDQNIIEKAAAGELAKFEVLHFATHGFTEGNWLFCPRSPPALLTSLAPQNSDGILSFDEIARLNLDANLVFLAACDTAASVEDEEVARASGLQEAGGSLEGLVRAFLTARARAVVATSWVAPDGQTTQDLVRTFYEAGRTGDVGAALRAGQLALIRDPASSHPFRWGPFFVVGDSSKPLISSQAAAVRPTNATAGGQ